MNLLQKIIESFTNKTSAGHDNISQKLIKVISNELKEALSKLINISIKENIYPDILKIAKVLPIHKNGEKQNPNNYRPISLLSTFNKIFEKIIYNQLTNYIESNNITYQKQFGFRKYHSTICRCMMVMS